MTTAVAEAMTRQATVAEASQVAGRDGATQWALKLEIKDISQFPIPCFMPLERAAQVLKGSTHLVTMRRGKTKQGKEGKYPSEFFWDLTHWDVQAPPPQAPAAQAPSVTGKLWDAADTQSRISWAQAVNLAVEAIGSEYFTDKSLGRDLALVESWANRFYPLIRQGPTAQAGSPVLPVGEGDIDPESLPWDVPQRLPEATGWASAPEADSRPMLPPFPIRGEREAPVNYFIRVAAERYGLKTQKEALAVIGGTWSGWVDKQGPLGDGETALQAALEKLGPAKAGG